MGHRIRPLALGLAFSLVATAAAMADDAPLDLHAPAPKQTPSAKSAKPAPKAIVDVAEAVPRANAYFDAARVMTADFVQIGPDGSRSEGELYMARPGRMLFRYSPPSRLEIVADGRSVAVRDQKLQTQDVYFIAQTPLKFLLSDHIDLAKDTKILRVTSEENAVTIELEDKATFGGSAHITLVFNPDPFALKQWTVIDAQGFQTVVTLFDIDLTTKPDPALFHIDERLNTSGPAIGKK